MEITIKLHGIDSETLCKIMSLILYCLCYIPQIRLNLKNGTPMNDISYTSLGMNSMSIILWGYFMYKMEYYIYACCTFFVFINILFLITMKVYFYIKSVNEHYKSYGQPPPDPATTMANIMVAAASQQQNSSNDV